MEDDRLEKAFYWEDEDEVSETSAHVRHQQVTGRVPTFEKKIPPAQSFICKRCKQRVYLKRKRLYCTDCQELQRQDQVRKTNQRKRLKTLLKKWEKTMKNIAD